MNHNAKANDLALDKTLLSIYEARESWFISQGIATVQSKPEYLNELINSDSPYLLSHALQPINWLPWSQSFVQNSNKSSKLIFVSIGYSTCHWCHVMAEESFSSLEIAQILNHDYTSIKVDREQWPLVDNRFKSALEVLKGNAGWPINVVLTPDGNIVWIDSYLTKDNFKKILAGLARRWQQKPQAVLTLSNRIKQQLKKDLYYAEVDKQHIASSSVLNTALPKQHKNILNLLKAESAQKGPRFLRANWSLGQLDEYLRTGDRAYLNIVESQVRSILLSPTYDAIEGGFHRYAVDGSWQQPHFEKMLYTQANMMRVLSKLYAITNKREYLTALEQTNSWVKQWLKQPHGYASAVSALSDGIEGAYYQLPQGVIQRDSQAKTYFQYNRANHLAPHTSLLSLKTLPEDWRATEFVSKVQSYRDIATKPLIDEKVLVSWNALYAIALMEAFTVTNDQMFFVQAEQLINSLWQHFFIDGRLFRSEFLGKVSIEAQFDDYALFALALLKLSFYESWAEMEQASSAKIRADILLNTLRDTLTSKASFKALMALNTDGEIASIKSSVYEAFVKGYKLLKEPSYNKLSRSIASFDERQLHLLVNEYNLSNQLSAKATPVNVGQAYFANGNGKITLTKKNNGITANFELKPGWHINADLVMDERYLPTQLSIRNLSEPNSAQIEVTYPKAKLQSLSFSNKPLKLFEGDFNIQMDASNLNVMEEPMVIINLQSCSDKLCLLPEKINILTVNR